MDPYYFRNPRDEVAALDFHFALLPDGRGRPDLDLDLLGRGLADQEVVVLAHELHDRLVQLVAAGADRRVRDDPREGDHRDFGRTAADVDHHVPRWRLDGKPDADRRRHRLGDHVDLFGPGRLRRVPHGALFDFGDARWHTHDHLGLHAEQVAVDDGLEEGPQHLSADVQV